MEKENLNEVIWYGNHFNLHKGYIRYRESPNSEYRRYSYSDLSAKVLDAPQYEICEWLFTFKGMAYAAGGFFVISAFSGFASFLYLLVIAQPFTAVINIDVCSSFCISIATSMFVSCYFQEIRSRLKTN